MIPTPFRFEKDLTPPDLEIIGKLSLRWSHTEHIIGNCLRVLLRLTDEEAEVMVFPLTLDQRLQRIAALAAINPLPAAADPLYRELVPVIRALQPIRNLLTHTILLPDAAGKHSTFHLRSKGKSMTKEEVFQCEELTNYAAHAALLFRHELGDKDPAGAPGPLPARPSIPECLRGTFHWG